MQRTAIALLSAFSLATAAHAVEYTQVQPDKSQITFAYQQMGVAMQGAFKKFSGQLRFDPAAPAAAKSTIEVELASVDTGSSEGDTEVATKTWFDTKAFPRARFESGSVKALGGNKYEVAGKLTIKGTAHDVTVPVALAQSGATTTATGTLPLKRLAFKIGENEWADTSMVADDVQVKFKLALTGIGKL